MRSWVWILREVEFSSWLYTGSPLLSSFHQLNMIMLKGSKTPNHHHRGYLYCWNSCSILQHACLGFLYWAVLFHISDLSGPACYVLGCPLLYLSQPASANYLLLECSVSHLSMVCLKLLLVGDLSCTTCQSRLSGTAVYLLFCLLCILLCIYAHTHVYFVLRNFL